MNFCIECETLILKLQERECFACGHPFNNVNRIKYYEKDYKKNNKEKIYNQSLEDLKGTKILYNCDKCNSKYMYYKAVQIRGADEGQTIFYECDCGYRKKVNS